MWNLFFLKADDRADALIGRKVGGIHFQAFTA